MYFLEHRACEKGFKTGLVWRFSKKGLFGPGGERGSKRDTCIGLAPLEGPVLGKVRKHYLFEPFLGPRGVGWADRSGRNDWKKCPFCAPDPSNSLGKSAPFGARRPKSGQNWSEKGSVFCIFRKSVLFGRGARAPGGGGQACGKAGVRGRRDARFAAFPVRGRLMRVLRHTWYVVALSCHSVSWLLGVSRARSLSRSRPLSLVLFLARALFVARALCRSRSSPLALFVARALCRSRSLSLALFVARALCRSRSLSLVLFVARSLCRSLS